MHPSLPYPSPVVQFGCLEVHLPQSLRPDLVLVENHEPKVSFSVTQYTERVVWRIMMFPFGPPALEPQKASEGVNVSSTEVAGGNNPEGESGTGTDLADPRGQLRNQSGSGGDPVAAAAARQVVPAFLFVNVISAKPPVCTDVQCGENMMEGDIQPLLNYYGFGAVSTRDTLRAVANSSFEAARKAAMASGGTGQIKRTPEEVEAATKKAMIDDMTGKSM